MTTTDPTTGPQIASGDHDKAAAHHDAMLREIEALRSQLAEAREMAAVDAEIIDDLRAVLGLSPGQSLPKAVTQLRDDLAQLRSQLAEAREHWRQVADALARAETERDQARAEIARLERAAHEQGADLWIAEDRVDWLRKRVRLAMDLLCSPTVPHEKGPDVPGAYGILSHVLAATAPETAPTAPQTDEQAQVRGESHTEPAGTVDDALHRIALHRIADHLGIPPQWISPAKTAWRVIAEIDRLRAEVKHLSARVREWEAVNADLAARCDSGDIPIRLGERYSQAVLREIDRLRAALGSQGGSR